ncbi:M23 family peptidase [Phormidesmis priestleyi ULC007]|uniref:M23 family peptidase n=1 Tax=Phormidesmis priestleyi ULC007 TaxID=1920490 RepID=A0A2T1D5T6_9CYAN|nr:M23 family metallopeptidase [Phormidesmis priestleyi]PSB15882.1 M23 family peptidase [Phormidesmis priestleyi ULC007]PZO53505.1 MAG: M23 family peptidase [Phormidesmis priestleyi]
MQQVLKLMTLLKSVSKRHLILLAGLSFITAILLGWSQGNATASEPSSTQVAVGGTWQGASFPVENFQGYTSPFGYRQSPDGSSNQEFHRGLDMAAPEGSYIRSWWAGKVVEVTDNTACGTSIVIQSGEWEHIYCHMNGHVETNGNGQYLSDRNGGLQIWEGQMIPAGARIGRVGMTGRTTGPHLHWGLKYSRQWVDPAMVLRAMYAEQSGSRSVSSRP